MSQPSLTAAVRQLRRAAGADRSDADLLRAFASTQDPDAFTAIVQRYHGLVLGICRRVLGHEQDAEDVCQATFLVLAGSAARIRRGESLVGWLYGTAYRLARKAQREACRRRAREERTRRTPSADPVAELTWREVRQALDEEIQRLPATYRGAFVLCCLEGVSHAEAGRRLGLAEGSISSRVSRARLRLHERLSWRGVELSAMLAAVAVAAAARAAGAVDSTARAAVAFAAGERAGISGNVLNLARGAIPTMWTSPMRLTAIVITLAALGLGAKLIQEAGARPAAKAEAARAAPPAEKERRPDAGTTEVRGRVLGPDGKPVRGAKLFIADDRDRPPRPAPQPTTDAAGRFRFRLGPAAGVEGGQTVLARADKFGMNWRFLAGDYGGEEVVLKLRNEVPIAGKVFDLEGRPVRGAGVWVYMLEARGAGSLDEVLKLWRMETGNQNRARALLHQRFLDRSGLDGPAEATTDAAGRFTLAGLGAETVATLYVRGPGVASGLVKVVLRPGFRQERTARGKLVHGPSLTLALAPAKPITGVVRDERTGKPVAGVRVTGQTTDRSPSAVATTDAEGRYRLDGLPKRDEYNLEFQPARTQRYLPRRQKVTGTHGTDAIRADVGLHPGVVVTGRVFNQKTRAPVRAYVTYGPLAGNDDEIRRVNYLDRPVFAQTDADGRYRVVVLPGPGVLLIQATQRGAARFPRATLAAKDDDPELFDRRFQSFRTAVGAMYPLYVLTAYRILRPDAKAKALTCDVGLEPGQTRSGKFVDAGGKPVTGVTAHGLWDSTGHARHFRAATFTADGLNPADPLPVLFWHHDRKLSALVKLRGDEKEPLTITLRPMASITGRLLGADGKPLAGAAITPSYQDSNSFVPALNSRAGFYDTPVRTDANGRFLLDNVPAGLRLYVIASPRAGGYRYSPEAFTLEHGQTKDLGDWKPR